MTIRHVSKQGRDEIIARRPLENEENLELQTELGEHVSFLIGWKYPTADEKICTNLCAGVLFRQKRFLYRKERERGGSVIQQAPGLVALAGNPLVSVATALAPEVSSHMEPVLFQHAEVISKPEKSVATSKNTADVFDEKLLDSVIKPKKTPPSVRSLRQDGEIEWPRAPKCPPGKTEVECPYCFDFLTKEELANDGTWR
jgi:hypothetical protein